MKKEQVAKLIEEKITILVKDPTLDNLSVAFGLKVLEDCIGFYSENDLTKVYNYIKNDLLFEEPFFFSEIQEDVDEEIINYAEYLEPEYYDTYFYDKDDYKTSIPISNTLSYLVFDFNDEFAFVGLSKNDIVEAKKYNVSFDESGNFYIEIDGEKIYL